MSSYSRQQLEAWLKTIEVKSGRVLDVGGSQNPLSKKRLKVFEPDEYKILDLEEPHECKKKPDIICDLNFYNRLEKEHLCYPGYSGENGCGCDTAVGDSCDCECHKSVERFDIAFCLEVSEYLWNPVQALRNISEFLKKGGILYISFHFIYPHHNPEGEDYLRYTKWGGEKLLKETGFKIEKMVPRKAEHNNLLEAFYSADGMRPSKGYGGHSEVGYLVKAIKL